MAIIEFEEGTIRVDATIIAEGLGIEPSLVLDRLREGRITSLWNEVSMRIVAGTD
jgi:hypothetical protein